MFYRVGLNLFRSFMKPRNFATTSKLTEREKSSEETEIAGSVPNVQTIPKKSMTDLEIYLKLESLGLTKEQALGFTQCITSSNVETLELLKVQKWESESPKMEGRIKILEAQSAAKKQAILLEKFMADIFKYLTGIILGIVFASWQHFSDKQTTSAQDAGEKRKNGTE